MSDLLEIKDVHFMQRGYATHHQVCNICGKEITKLNLAEGFLTSEPHYVYTLKNGLTIRQCRDRENCVRRCETDASTKKGKSKRRRNN